MINHENKFIFIHIGKTGGSTIERVLDPNVKLDESRHTLGMGNTSFREKHWKITTYQKKYKKHFNAYFKFTFVRNPWDREVSRWKWFALARGEDVSFKYHLQCKGNNYSRWICEDGQYLTDFIGRFENLQGDFDIICDKLGISRQELPHYNKTNHKHYTEYYDDETREIVARRYAGDIEYFGYKFGE